MEAILSNSTPKLLGFRLTKMLIAAYNNNNDRLTAFDPGQPG